MLKPNSQVEAMVNNAGIGEDTIESYATAVEVNGVRNTFDVLMEAQET